MFTNFRNGILSYQAIGNTPTFLTKTNSGTYYASLVTSSKDFAVTMAHGVAEYLVTFYNNETNIWGPFTGTDTNYLYLEVDTLTGQVSFGSSTVPITYGTVYPLTPVSGECFFDTNSMKTFMWTGASWVNKIRVYVGEVSSSSVVGYTGTVTGSLVPYSTGPIIYSSGGRAVLKHDKTFFTFSEKFFINNIPFGTSSLEQSAVAVRANTSLAADRFVKINSMGTIDYAQPADVGVNIIFILTEPMSIGEITYLPVGGVVNNSSWSWASIGADIFVGENGVLSLTDPVLSNNALPSKPAVAKTLSVSSVLINPLAFINIPEAPAPAPVQSSSMVWELIDTNTVAVPFTGYVVNLESNSVEVTLPATPSVNDEIVISVDTYIPTAVGTCTIAANGKLIKWQSSDITMDTNITLRFIWIGGLIGWAIV